VTDGAGTRIWIPPAAIGADDGFRITRPAPRSIERSMQRGWRHSPGQLERAGITVPPPPPMPFWPSQSEGRPFPDTPWAWLSPRWEPTSKYSQALSEARLAFEHEAFARFAKDLELAKEYVW